MTTRQAQLSIEVLCSATEVAATVHDRRSEAIALFDGLGELQRQALVFDAWTIGVRAIQNAHAAAQEARLEEVGQSLLADIDKQLRAHVEQQHTQVGTALARYFDPQDGHVTRRMKEFVEDQGVLARFLEKYLGPQNSILAESLARQVGETSPLFKLLSPTESQGLVATMETRLREVLAGEHGEMVRALDPLCEDGAVARFLKSLREELKGAAESREKQLAVALAALDANDEHSLISRLMKEATRARQDVLAAVNPDAPSSPMAILKTSLTKLLQEHAVSQAEVARRQEERQGAFEAHVREALTRLETRRAQDLKSPRGGMDFEATALSFLADFTKNSPCVLSPTGGTAGIGRSKKGDAVLAFTAESAFAGARIVFEVKQEEGYTVQRALEELDLARKNRGAGAGVFIMARTHATDVFPRFARHGNNVLVIWDATDPATDPFLQAAIILGVSLVSRIRTAGDEGDITALRDIEKRIEDELSRLERIAKHSDAIRRGVDGISEEMRKAEKALAGLLKKAQSTLRALNVEVCEEEAERRTPIQLEQVTEAANDSEAAVR